MVTQMVSWRDLQTTRRLLVLPPPTSPENDVGGGGTHTHRVVCKSRQRTIWVTMLCGLRAEESATLPRLPEELWLYTFGLLKHDQQPTFVPHDA